MHTYPVSSNLKVSHLDTNGIYAVLTFEDGSVSVHDVQNEFSHLCEIERAIRKDGVGISLETQGCLKAFILPDQHPTYKYMAGTHSKHLFRILTLKTPCSLRLQHFDGEYRTKSFSCSYEIDGVISGFDVHPSGDYIIISSDQGLYYVFRIDTGELRGKVPITTDPSGLSIDPSGLYMAIAVKNNACIPETLVRKKWALQNDDHQ